MSEILKRPARLLCQFLSVLPAIPSHDYLRYIQTQQLRMRLKYRVTFSPVGIRSPFITRTSINSVQVSPQSQCAFSTSHENAQASQFSRHMLLPDLLRAPSHRLPTYLSLSFHLRYSPTQNISLSVLSLSFPYFFPRQITLWR